ncbi:ATP-binding cassette domain-containing protein [Ostreibacterium oceani]|uniref:ATP-binding cassette domain-containing protein n=1 Tax=Ostreibacterium oceani TaxID=2654998 RepID=A0A6N7EWM2_9GAMM|nr:ATP-binding cassette domain-containing protein [Ostreibacterium oceani]MPV86313.1 ATP-binding cassette domain-containing protein [Ostreibacterium oceani]
MALIQLSEINYRVADKTILTDIDLQVNDGEIITIVGPNGSGKSTLLNIALGLLQPTQGSVNRQKGLRVGYVPQSINRDYTLPLSVFEFISLTKHKVKRDVIHQLLDDLSLSALKFSLLSRLSGGELRRVLFARALLNRPQLLVLDEPTAGIDINGQARFYQQLNALRERYQFAVLMVSHDLHFVMATTDRVICLNHHICCSGVPAQIVNNPSYMALFGEAHAPTLVDEIVPEIAPEIAFYQHQHDHEHDEQGHHCQQSHQTASGTGSDDKIDKGISDATD